MLYWNMSETDIQFPELSVTYSVTLSQLLNLPRPQFLHQYKTRENTCWVLNWKVNHTIHAVVVFSSFKIVVSLQSYRSTHDSILLFACSTFLLSAQSINILFNYLGKTMGTQNTFYLVYILYLSGRGKYLIWSCYSWNTYMRKGARE